MSSFFKSSARGPAKRPGSSKSNPRNGPKRPRGRAEAHSASAERDYAVSSSESESVASTANIDERSDSADSGDEHETAEERRLRLAERYLDRVKTDLGQDGFDAEEIDREIISQRLKDDFGATKGQVHKFIASKLQLPKAHPGFFRANRNPVYCVAASDRFIYIGCKDGSIRKWECMSSSVSKGPDSLDCGQNPVLVKGIHIRGIPKSVQQDKKTRGAHGGHSARAVGHSGPVLCCAVSPCSKYLATGGKDRKIILWNTSNMRPFKSFTQHRGPVTGLTFHNISPLSPLNKSTASQMLYSCSTDRSVKVWAVDEASSGYVGTLFGHQDCILDIDCLIAERCVSVGARDRTARLWKVSEESQLVFRGGGTGAIRPEEHQEGRDPRSRGFRGADLHHEGSVDRVAIIDSQHFLTGSDNGLISLWTTSKKKPIFSNPYSHGLEPCCVDQISRMDQRVGIPRAITGLKALPQSDFFVSGSWDGTIRCWKITSDMKRFESLGELGQHPSSGVLKDPVDRDEKSAGDSSDRELIGSIEPAARTSNKVRGIVNDIAIYDRMVNGQFVVCIIAAVAKEHRLMRRLSDNLSIGSTKNGVVIWNVPCSDA